MAAAMSVVYVLTTPIHEDGGDDPTMKQVMKRNKWDNDDYVCRCLILKEAKYMAKDASSVFVSNFTNYKIIDSRPVMEQHNELLGILGRFTQHKMNMDEAIQVSCIIDKLSPSWKDFKHTLKHKKEELTLVELGSHLPIEESLMARDSDKPKGNNVVGPLPDPKLKHLGERGIECIFVGYAEHSKAFRIPNGTEDIDGSVVPEEVTEEVVQQPEPELRKSKRNRTPKDFGPEFQLYLIEGTRNEDVAFWKEAINDEMDSIMGNNTWVLADLPPGCKPLGCKWIFKRKLKVDGTIEKFKARLVIQGFKQKSGIDYFDTYAPVARISTIRLLIAMASIHNLIIHQMDVKTAFLNDGLDQKVDLTKEFLSSKFSMKDMGEADVILGIRIKHEMSTPMDTSEKLMPNNGLAVSQLEYSRVIGCLMYAMTCTRPDIAFVVGKLSRLTYTGYPLVLEGYTDASWISNTEDNSSTSGWVFLLGGGAISWASKKQTCITGSIMESEFVALTAAGKEAKWLKNLLFEIPLWVKPIAPISIRCDSATTLAKAYSQMYNGKSRHLGVRHSMIRELIMNGVISIEFVRSQQNLADHLTKGLARDLVIKSAEGVGLKRLKHMYLHIISRMCLEPKEKEDEVVNFLNPLEVISFEASKNLNGNIGLLGKWKWRFLTEKDALWRTAIKEFYGDCGGFGSLSGSRGPNGIWCDIIKAVEDIEKIDPSFKRSFHIKVLNGANVSFWKDPWCENGSRLMDLFPRLYALDSFQDCKIVDRWHLADGSWCGKWDWIRPPRGRATGDVIDLVSTIGNLSLSSDSTDRWTWSKDASGIYKVSTLSNTFQSISLADCNLGVHHKWNSWIPRKVNICVWRGSLNRLPTRINLSSRGIPLVTNLCPFCNNEEEDLDHCLIKCSRVLPIWKKVWSWWHLPTPSSFPSFGIKDIALGTITSNGCLLSNKAIHGVFQSTFWAIWKWRNKIINAQHDRVDSIREEDIFPSIQRVSKILDFCPCFFETRKLELLDTSPLRFVYCFVI
ncbi:zinc finger, CCHC-type containing protein [Tanacetum coccineum]|uniref:Zinc finger, CCHC-type containing protein n=1 Tax=Tanacetum coccineum TaxID=301880 RepID=A0ABQ5DPU7_9ASTR